METKLTAVEWLIEELGEYFPHEIAGIHLMVENAKAMEKWQIVNAHWNGGEIFDDTGKLVTGEMYYNETYGK